MSFSRRMHPLQLRNLVFALWKRGAYLGDPWCTFGVANAYEEGIGVDKGSRRQPVTFLKSMSSLQLSMYCLIFMIDQSFFSYLHFVV